MSLTHKELVAAIAAKIDVPNARVEEVIKGLKEVVTEELGKGEKVTINNLVTFTIKEQAARTGRNPQTGQPLEIAAKRVLKVTPSKPLKDALPPLE
ncbi:HU family DNA-binding protein [Pseudomonas luteola]